ncbi:MAG TPA: hypothetical protein VLK85_23140 [Ramlibacter sp.]|nr:hypothetical protein [Ramlibacter sp.]
MRATPPWTKSAIRKIGALVSKPTCDSQAAPGLRTTPVPALLVVVILTAMLLAAGLTWEPFRALLRFSLPSPSALLAAVASGCAAGLIGVWAARPAKSASTKAAADAAP